MKLIIAGSRYITDYKLLETTLQDIVIKYNITEIVSGHASGVDSLGERYAREHNIPIKLFPADWKTYGKSAGPIRNKQMALYADALVVIRYADSRGSANMLSLAKQHGLRYRDVVVDKF